MANTYNWRFFQDTGLVGGTANAGDKVFYIDSYNGSDITGVGSNDNPFNSIQQALDSSAAGGADYIIAGKFEEGDFVNKRTNTSLIPEGRVIIDGSANTTFELASTKGWYGISYHNGNGDKRQYGKLIFSNFNGDSLNRIGRFDSCEFYNMPYIFFTSLELVTNCFFENCILGGFYYFEPYFVGGINIIEHNTFINTTLKTRGTYTYIDKYIIRGNYFDATSTFDANQITGVPTVLPIQFDYNFFEGTLTDKIKIGGSSFNNTEALQAGFPTLAVNDLPSSTSPLFNNIPNEDYTLQPTSPLLKAGHDKKQIGALNLGSTHSTNDTGVFDYVNIDTTTSGEITLSGGGSGTATTKTLQHHELDVKKRLITNTLSPNLEQNFGLGETMGNLAADNTPPKTDIEIQYSTSYSLTNGVDGTASYNGAWLRVPIGEQPYHDTFNNVGNDDPLFDIDNAITIRTRYIKMRITLRDDESPLV